MLARSHFQQKVQMQPQLENMKNIKHKKKCENVIDWLQSSDIGPLKSDVANPSLFRQKRSFMHFCKKPAENDVAAG